MHGSLTARLRTKPYIRPNQNRLTIAQAGAAAVRLCCRALDAMLRREELAERCNLCTLTPAEVECSAGGITHESHLIALSGSVNLVQLNLSPLLRRECCSCFVPGSYTAFLAHSSGFITLPFCAVTILSSLVAILHFLSLFFFNRALWPVSLSCLLLSVTLPATCSSFSGLALLCPSYLYIYLRLK